MSDVKWCGHDSRGNVTYTYNEKGDKVVLDEIPLVADKYLEMR
jgi:type I restriction enzyme M protein